jgi:hypothetical protein
MTGRARYEDWTIEVEVIPAMDGGWGQMAITVIGDDGCFERKITPSVDVFETSESAIENGKGLAVEWIRKRG